MGRLALPIAVLIIVMLLRWPLVLLLEFLVERILPTKFHYWLLMSIAAAVVAVAWVAVMSGRPKGPGCFPSMKNSVTCRPKLITVVQACFLKMVGGQVGSD
jgi:hypothetical protein